ncbi:hypothetical protein ACP4OV_014513 [Aristida adscensionis]
MPVLVTAYVRLGEPCCDLCFDTCFDFCRKHNQIDRGVLFGGLSNVTNLGLAAHDAYRIHTGNSGVAVLKRDMKSCPIFSNLKTLVLNGCVMAREVGSLVCFLQHAPILEEIILQLYDLRDEVKMGEWCSSLEEFVPSEHLKMVEVRCKKVDVNVHKFVEILNTYGIPSDLVNIRETDN